MTDRKNSLFAVVFFLILAVYCFFVAQFGFEFWDTGYIPSYSWRIANGQHVYEDFVYKAPPITLYFQSIIMQITPEYQQFLWLKRINYLLFALQVALSVFAIKNFYKDKFIFNSWLVISFAFVVSLQNFSAYPWPTSDGLLFASIAFYFLSLKSKNAFRLTIVGIFAVLSSLTKQSFYLVPVGFLVTVFLLEGKKRGLFFLIVLATLFGLFFAWISHISSLEKFIQQTTGQTHFKDLAYSGFLDYFITYSKRAIVVPILLVLSFLPFFYPKRTKWNSHSYFHHLGIILLLYSIFLSLTGKFLPASRIAFLGCVVLVLLKMKLENTIKSYVPILLLLLFAWSCSISMGYNYPIMYATGIILSVSILLSNYCIKIRRNHLVMGFFGVMIILSFSKNFNPYRDESILSLKYDLQDVNPKLAGIKTTEKNKQKLLEAKSLISKYGKKYIMAPGFPMAHYIFGTQSIVPSDWLINNEINRQASDFIRIAAKKKHYVFLEKSFIEGELYLPENREDFSKVSMYIYRNFKKIDETEHFIVYNTQEKKEPFPTIERKPVH